MDLCDTYKGNSGHKKYKELSAEERYAKFEAKTSC